MIDWIKPSGATASTNDLEANIKAAEALGWKRADTVEDTPERDSRGVEWDAELHAEDHSRTSKGEWKLKAGLTRRDEADRLEG